MGKAAMRALDIDFGMFFRIQLVWTKRLPDYFIVHQLLSYLDLAIILCSLNITESCKFCEDTYSSSCQLYDAAISILPQFMSR